MSACFKFKGLGQGQGKRTWMRTLCWGCVFASTPIFHQMHSHPYPSLAISRASCAFAFASRIASLPLIPTIIDLVNSDDKLFYKLISRHGAVANFCKSCIYDFECVSNESTITKELLEINLSSSRWIIKFRLLITLSFFGDCKWFLPHCSCPNVVGMYQPLFRRVWRM